jgi:hypothetical protein
MSILGWAQRGRPLPSDPSERARWTDRGLAATVEIDETSPGMLLCPEFAEDDVRG